MSQQSIFDTPAYLYHRGGIPVSTPALNIQEELKKMQRGQATIAWLNSSKEYNKKIPPETIFVDHRNAGIQIPDYTDPALDLAKARQLAERYAKDPSSTNLDKKIHDPWYNNFWYNEALNHEKLLNEGDEMPGQPGVYTLRAGGGVIATTDSPAINVINVQAEINGLDITDYILIRAIDQEITPNLTMSIDSWSGFTVYQDIAEGDSTFQQKGGFTRQTFGLKKDVGHIAATDESGMVADRDVWQYHVRHVGTEMFKVKNIKVAIELLTATITSGGADWGVKVSGISTNNPIEQLRTAIKQILANGGTPSRMVSGSDPYSDFGQNTNNNGTTEPIPGLNFGNRITTNSQLPGLTWYVDDLATQTGVIIFDPRAVKYLQGPVRTAMYRNEDRGINAYITRDWNRVATVDSTIIRQLTAVSA